MSLHPSPIAPVPEETARVACAAFPKGNLYVKIRNELGTIYSNEQFADLFPTVGQSAQAPWQLALVTVFQFLEGLSDRQAAEAVRSRIDWKYALGLELSNAGFDASVLCEFRARLLSHGASERLLEVFLQACQARGWLKAGGKQRTDSTHVLAAVRTLNRLELVGETVRAALESVALVAPQWLRSWVPPDWFERYSRRIEDWRLPGKEAERKAYAEQIGADGARLLTEVYDPQAPAFLRELPALQEVRLTWLHQFFRADGVVHLRAREDLPPCALRHDSPYDPQAHYSTKRGMSWIGDKVHLTETCDQEQPHLITHVETTPAPTADGEQTARIHEALANKELLPAEHLVDTGYVEAEGLLSSQQRYGIHLLGPVRPDPSWQAQQETGYDLSHFRIDWQKQQVTCPQGVSSRGWLERTDQKGGGSISVQFPTQACRDCPVRSQCTHASQQPRHLMLLPQAQHEALQQTRQTQQTEAFKQAYGLRAGVEGTISQAVRAFGLRQTRYLGLAKTHLQQVGTAVAMDLCRLDDWLTGKPRARTRTSHFAALAPVA